MVDEDGFAYGNTPTADEQVTHDPDRVGVATKCNFCVDVIDEGIANDLTPGIDPEATPRCVNSCISGAMTFGDLDDPDSNVNQLLNSTKHFRMKTEEGTCPCFFYIVDEE